MVLSAWRGRSNGAKDKKIIPIPGEHNISNALAVMALGKVLKIPEKKIFDRDRFVPRRVAPDGAQRNIKKY